MDGSNVSRTTTTTGTAIADDARAGSGRTGGWRDSDSPRATARGIAGTRHGAVGVVPSFFPLNSRVSYAFPSRWAIAFRPRTASSSSSDPSRRAPEGSDVCCESGCSWQGAITMAKKKKKAAKKVAKKKKARK